jgi:hypothetical protein
MPNRKVRNRSAAAIAIATLTLLGALFTAGASTPASAAARPAKPAAAPSYATLCRGDLCVQTKGIGTSFAVVNERANYRNFRGHFELAVPSRRYALNSPGGDVVWHAGGAGHNFPAIYFPCATYQATAWQLNPNGRYTDIGRVNFGVGLCP